MSRSDAIPWISTHPYDGSTLLSQGKEGCKSDFALRQEEIESFSVVGYWKPSLVTITTPLVFILFCFDLGFKTPTWIPTLGAMTPVLVIFVPPDVTVTSLTYIDQLYQLMNDKADIQITHIESIKSRLLRIVVRLLPTCGIYLLLPLFDNYLRPRSIWIWLLIRHNDLGSWTPNGSRGRAIWVLIEAAWYRA